MKNTGGPIIKVLSKNRLTHLMKTEGLQAYLLDNSRFTLYWDGLEYRFYIRDNRLYLDSVSIRMDIDMGPMEKYETDAYRAWLQMRYR